MMKITSILPNLSFIHFFLMPPKISVHDGLNKFEIPFTMDSIHELYQKDEIVLKVFKGL